MKIRGWIQLFSSIWDWGKGAFGVDIPYPVPGTDIDEWIELAKGGGYDEIDLEMIDSETKGA